MTLTETAKLTKTTLLVSAVIFVVSLSGWLSFQFWYTNYYLPSKPPVIIPPEVKFGVLPKLQLPNSNVSSSNFSYSLDTETGELPTGFPDLVKVYFVPQLGTSLLASEKARDIAKSLEFTGEPETIDSTAYRIRDGKGGSIVIDANTGNFKFNREVASSSANPQTQPLKDKDGLSTDFKSFLQKSGLLKAGLSQERLQVDFEKFVEQDSSFAEVSIFPADIDELKVVTPTFNKGLVQATISRLSPNETKYTKMVYAYWEPDRQNSSTYPIKTAETAFAELKGGKGTVIIEPKQVKVSLTSVYLAYYEPETYPQYLQPVYVFEGGNFVAYIPAITEQYLE